MSFKIEKDTLLLIGRNKQTGDRSYSGEVRLVIAVNDEHVVVVDQVKDPGNFFYGPHILLRNEYDLSDGAEISSDIKSFIGDA